MSTSKVPGPTIKRVFDIVVSLVILILFSPLIGLIALAIKLDDGGPVLYPQDRVSKDSKAFRCYKFCTMVAGAENGRGALRAYTAGRKARSSVDLAA